MLRKFPLKLLSVLTLDILAVFFIFKNVGVFAQWYLTRSPVLGVDLYNSATYVFYHLSNFSLPFNSFKDFWFGGYPLMRDFPQLSFYLMLPFGYFFGPHLGVQIFVVFSLFLFIFSCYLLFFELSKNYGLALLLSTLILLSPNIYGSAIWAGSIPYFASQFIFPLGLFLGVKYLKAPSFKKILAIGLVSGIGILIHPLGVIAFLAPSLLIIIFFGLLKKNFSVGRLFRFYFLFFIIFILSSFILTYDLFLTFFIGHKLPSVVNTSNSGVVQEATETSRAISEFYKNQLLLLKTDTDPSLFLLLALGFPLVLIGFFLIKSKRKIFVVVPFLFITIYVAAHPALNFSGLLNVLRHDPYRAFWPFPVAIGALACALWGLFFTSLSERLQNFKRIGKSFNFLIGFALSVFFIGIAYVNFSDKFPDLTKRLESKSEYSSAFPEALSINLNKENVESLKKQITPSFLDPSDKNKRLYAVDAAVNIWWNSFFNMPLARGYLDPPIGTDRRGGFFWLDIAIANDTLVREFKVSPSQAFANALFLIDWYGIGFFEGGRLGSKGPAPAPSSYLLENKIFDAEEEVTTFGAVLKWQTLSGKPELHLEIPQILKFYKVDEKFTSPILSPTNATPVLIFSNWPAYEDLIRLLGASNINSKKIIPVYGGEFIDKMDSNDLKNFDGVILHQYKYKNKDKAFSMLSNYVKKGGMIFIDTGGEAKESDGKKLPEIFPFDASLRKKQGREWEIKATESKILEGVNVDNFGPLVFGDDEWKITTPENGQLRGDTNGLLFHKNIPILAQRNLGKGKIIWSGINLAYHFNQYKSDDEAKLFLNILDELNLISDVELPKGEVQWEGHNMARASFEHKSRGVLFKEEGYDGWKARMVKPNQKSLPIYKAGPTYPGFMYAPLPTQTEGPTLVEFKYSGKFLYWVVSFINFFVILLVLYTLFLGNVFRTRIANFAIFFIKKRLSTWWGKEEE